jgi:hypothetical protein
MRESLLNKVFGKLTVFSFSHSNTKRNFWKCMCECGSIKIFSTSDIKKRNSCGCLKKTHFHNMEGKEFNGLKICNLIGKNKYKSYIYSVSCICGNSFIAEGNDIKQGKIKSCGCKQNSLQILNQNTDLRLKNGLYSDYRNKAAKREIDFALTQDEFFDFLKKSCYYCNSKPSNVVKDNRKNSDASFVYSGIDRIDNDLGYIKENCVSCCRTCNQAKHAMTVEAFKKWIFAIINAKQAGIGIWKA